MNPIISIFLLLWPQVFYSFYLSVSPSATQGFRPISAMVSDQATIPVVNKNTNIPRSYVKVRTAYNYKIPDKRRLSLKEEVFAGKLCRIAKELDKKKNALEKSLQREPNLQEWATYSNLTVKELKQTLRLSQLAREKLILHNLRLVDYVVCEFLDRKASVNLHPEAKSTALYSGLFQHGVIGLKKATEYYDGRYKFSFFAIHFIREECHRYFTSESQSNYVPHTMMQLGTRINNVKKRMAEELQRLPTDEEVGARISFSASRVRGILSFIQRKSKVRSLSQKLRSENHHEGESLTYADSLIRSSPVEEKLSQNVLMEFIDQASLTDVEKDRLLSYFDLKVGIPKARGRGTLQVNEAINKLSQSSPFSEEWIGSFSPSVGLVPSLRESLVLVA